VKNREPHVVTCQDLPDQSDEKTIYRLLPKNPNEAYYWERTERARGWITKEEQASLRTRRVGIAGNGGMGGILPAQLARTGIGLLNSADSEKFDDSNIQRQAASGRYRTGKSKAFETAKMTREVTDDFTLTVYAKGITPETADHFLVGDDGEQKCDLVLDLVEFWAVGSRILIHERARKFGIPVMNGNSIGFGTRLFLFTRQSATMEECLGMDYAEADRLQKKIQSKTATKDEVRHVQEAVMRGLLPEMPEYSVPDEPVQNREWVYRRLFEEGKASILPTNPLMAAGFLANHVLLYLLKDSSVRRNIVHPPEMPGYLYFDSATMESKIVTKRWF